MNGADRPEAKSILAWGGTGVVAAAPGSGYRRYGSDNVLLNGVPTSARPDTFIVVTFPGRIRNFRCWISVALGAGIDINYVIYVNEVATAILVNIGGAVEVNDQDLVNSVAVVAGDRVYLHADRGAGIPPAPTFGAVLELAAA